MPYYPGDSTMQGYYSGPYQRPSFGNLLGGSLLSFLPSILGRLFGGDPQAAYRKAVGKLTSPQNVAKEQQAFYQQLLASPAFSQAQGNIALGANVASNQLAQALGARGIGTSGTGAVLSSLTPSLVGSQQAGLRTSTYQSAAQQAADRIKAQIDALQGGGPSQNQQLFAAGLGPFGEYLRSWLQQRQGPPPGYYPQRQMYGFGPYEAAQALRQAPWR